MKINANLDTKLEGRFKISVVKADGTERFPIGKGYHKNLILNSGLDLFFTHSTAYSSGSYSGPSFIPELSANCRIGIGTTAAAVTDVALVNPVKWQASYNLATNANQTTYNLAAGSCTYKRTYDYSSEVGTVVYTELGIAPLQTGNLFSRIVIAPVTVNAGEQLRVVYELTVTISQYITPTAASGSSGTFNCAGNLKFVGQLSKLFGSVGANGNRVNGWYSCVLNGNTAFTPIFNGAQYVNDGLSVWLSAHSAFPASDTDLSPLTALAGKSQGSNTAYVAGTFTRTAEWVFSATNPIATVNTINTIIISSIQFQSTSNFTGNGLQLLLTSIQTKEVDYKLTLQFTWTASR
jgi:hypothetical protein